jgi:hypothetical protein
LQRQATERMTARNLLRFAAEPVTVRVDQEQSA